MKKEKKIAFRITEKEYENIKKEADKCGESISNYARMCMKKNMHDDWIQKTIVQQSLSKILASLDMREEKFSRVTEPIRNEVAKLWKRL